MTECIIVSLVGAAIDVHGIGVGYFHTRLVGCDMVEGAAFYHGLVHIVVCSCFCVPGVVNGENNVPVLLVLCSGYAGESREAGKSLPRRYIQGPGLECCRGRH